MKSSMKSHNVSIRYVNLVLCWVCICIKASSAPLISLPQNPSSCAGTAEETVSGKSCWYLLSTLTLNFLQVRGKLGHASESEKVAKRGFLSMTFMWRTRCNITFGRVQWFDWSTSSLQWLNRRKSSNEPLLIASEMVPYLRTDGIQFPNSALGV